MRSDRSEMEIRPYKPADIPAISRLYFNTIRRVNARDYTPAQIQAWAPTIYNNDYWLQRFKKRQVLVAEYGDKVVGFAEYKPSGHIDCFYVHHEHLQRGIGKALLERVVTELAMLNVRRLHVEVSVTARPFFTSHGFRLVEERHVEFNEQLFQLYLMEKYI